MGGLAIDESGNTSKIGPFLVRDDFEDGTIKAYGLPGKEFCGFDATKGTDWPKTYVAVVVVAEEDWGGFADGLAKAWATAAPMIKKKVQEGVENIAEPFIGDFLAEWLGKIVAWVVDNFVGWLIDLFADDIFKPGIAIGGLHTSVGLVYRNFAGWQNFASPPGKFTFVGHGGKYTRRLSVESRDVAKRLVHAWEEIMPESKRGKLHPVSFRAFVEEIHKDSRLKAVAMRNSKAWGFALSRRSTTI